MIRPGPWRHGGDGGWRRPGVSIVGTIEEDFLDCTGKKRRFRLQSYAAGMFLDATELLDGEAVGMRFVMRADADGVLPWGLMRDKIGGLEPSDRDPRFGRGLNTRLSRAARPRRGSSLAVRDHAQAHLVS